jgi:hypothetical protein
MKTRVLSLWRRWAGFFPRVAGETSIAPLLWLAAAHLPVTVLA